MLVPRFPTNRWILPQTADPTAPGFVTVRLGGGDAAAIIVSVDVIRWPALQKAHGATPHIMQVSAGGRTMEEGEWIEVAYGDTRGGSLGTQAQLSAREGAFPVFVAGGQEPRFLERLASWNRATDVATLRAHSDFNPTLRVVEGGACRFHVVAPMEVEPDRPLDVRVAAIDEGASAATGYRGALELFTTETRSPRLATVKAAGSSQTIRGVVLKTRGFHGVYVIDPHRGLVGVSHPIRVMEGARPLFWGEIHGHSELSDGNGTPDERYTYARDTVLLDFACVCDHDTHLYAHRERWEAACRNAREHTRAGEFVAVPAYEARVRSAEREDAVGDTNVYYRGDEGHILPPFTPPLNPDIAGDEEIILVRHTPLYGPPCAMGTQWDQLTRLDQGIVPLVEVFSTHGNSEYYDCPRRVLWRRKGAASSTA